MIHLYNGKEAKEFVQHYSYLVLNVSFDLTWLQMRKSDKLEKLFLEKIREIVAQVRDKLSGDAVQNGLIYALPQKKQKGCFQVFKVADYGTKKEFFDDTLYAISEYFELFKRNTDRLEDLFTQLHEALGLKRPPLCKFEHYHGQFYAEIVLKNDKLYVSTVPVNFKEHH